MYPVPQMAPVSDLKRRHLELFKRLKTGPVILANRSQPTAVLVSPERWNAIVEYIDDLEDLYLAESRARLGRKAIPLDEVERELGLAD